MNTPAELSLVRPVLGTPLLHESALAQVCGLAPYIDDIPELKGTLHAAPILSAVPHGRLLGVDAAAALAMPGVIAIVTAKDLPGDPIFAAQVRDEPIFAMEEVLYAGQVVEETDTRGLFRAPLHPYTTGLIGSVPVIGRRQEELAVIPGRVPNLIDLPPGCRFAPRGQAPLEANLSICTEALPALVEVAPGHKVRCFLHSDAVQVDAPTVGGTGKKAAT